MVTNLDSLKSEKNQAAWVALRLDDYWPFFTSMFLHARLAPHHWQYVDLDFRPQCRGPYGDAPLPMLLFDLWRGGGIGSLFSKH